MTPDDLPEIELVPTVDADGPLLEASGIVAGYVPEVNILNGCNVTVHRGELAGIIGPNGAGKSTLLKALFGLIPVRAGTVILRGKDITGKRAHALVAMGLGYVPQNNNVFPSLSVQENLEMGMYQRPAQFADRFDHVCGLFPLLGQRRNQRAGSLSGGERQMVAMGRALMARPEMLLLDEPSMGLSPILVETIFEIIRDINRLGTTILLVEQNARMALRVAHRGYVIQTGRIVLQDAALALLRSDVVRKAYLGEK